jgi:hypothetical protein
MAFFLYPFIRRITDNALLSLLITLAISLGTPLYKYATAFYGHVPAAAFYCLSFLIWLQARQRRFLSLPMAFLSSLLLGLTVITEYPAAALVLLLCPYMLYTLYQSRQLSDWRVYSLMAAAFAIPVCIQLYYNYDVFGSPLTTGYSHESNEVFQAAHAASFMGIGWPDLRVFFYMTFQPALGIIWQAPVLFPALIGWVFMAKRPEYRPEMYFSLGTILSYILLISGYYMWWGGTSFTPRHIIPILPIFALPLAFLPKKASIPILVTGLIAMGQNLLMTACGYEGLTGYLAALLRGRLISGHEGMAIYEVCLPNFINGQLVNSRGIQLLHLHGPASLIPLLILEAGLLAVFFKLTGNRAVEMELDPR